MQVCFFLRPALHWYYLDAVEAALHPRQAQEGPFQGLRPPAPLLKMQISQSRVQMVL